MPEAIHTARWIEQLPGAEWDLHLFPSRAVAPLDEMPPVTFHTLLPAGWQKSRPDIRNSPLIRWPYSRGRERIRQLQCTRNPLLATAAGQLAETINRIQPDIVHTLEMQLAGYMMNEALPFIRNRKRFKWVYSCWGNDITFYQNDPEHQQKMQAVLRNIDYYTADCPRDMQLIESFHLGGEPLCVFPTGGGYDLKALRSLVASDLPSRRKIIALKGYHSEEWTGRAINALRAMELCRDALSGYEVVIYRPSAPVQHVAQYLRNFSGMNIRCLPPWIDNLDVIRLMGQSRIAISTNSGDGTPNAMLEAMIMGAFPIQSSTADTTGWIEDGTNGIIVPYDDVDKIAAALRRAVRDDTLVDEGALISRSIVDENLDRADIARQVIASYKHILSVGQV